jgi:hypothetical protein
MDAQAAASDKQRIAEIQFSGSGPEAMIRVIVPHGTKLAETARLTEIISEKILGPRGCAQCHSGVPIFFQERLEHILRVDLRSGKTL